MFLSNLSISRPVLATVMMAALVTLGVASYRQLAIELYPSVEIPVITIVTVLPGASPEAVEREVTKLIEEAVNPIAGVDHVGSTSREGVSQVFVQFELEVDAAQAAQDARTKIAAIRGDLPAGIQDPIIEKMDIGGLPVMSLAVRSSSLSPRDLTAVVDRRVRPRLENVTGVGRLDLVGAVNREIVIEVRPDRLEALGMSVDEVMLGLRAENIDTPLGRMTGSGSELPLRVQGKARSVDEFRGMVITARAGRPIALGEVANVTDGIEEVRSLAFVNGTPAVALDVLKQTGANAVGVADAIRAEATAIQAELPAGTTIDIVRDGSVFIRESVADVQETLVVGGLLTVFIVFIFLNSWRSTVITGLTLPISVISSFIVMRFAGLTLNVMTLMALSLAIGLLIDDAIVVRENIVRHLEHGEDHFKAARDGTAEIGLAVLATSFSIIAVFLPVAFMRGIIGRFFFAFGITIAFAVAVSLFVSFTLDPMLSSRWLDPDIARTGRRNPISRLLDAFNRWFDRTADRYRGAIGWALDHRAVVLSLAVAAFVAGIAILGRLESEFFPTYDQGEFVATFRTAPSASIDETRGRLETVLSTLREVPEIESTYASIGAGNAGAVRDARVFLKLTPRESRTRDQTEIQRDVRARLALVPGIVGSLAQAESMDSSKPLTLDLRGEDIAVLRQYSQRLKNALYGVPGVVDLEATLEHDTPEYRLIVDRERASDMGLSSGMIAASVGALVGGQVVGTFEDEEGEARNVRVRLPADLRQNAAQIQALRLAVVRPGGGMALVPLGTVARYTLSTAPSEINRMDLSRQVQISGNLDGLVIGTAAAKASELAAGLNLPPGYRMVVSGENEIMVESFGYMAEALVLAIVFVYLILAAQFESFLHPLAIMLSLPLSIVGMAGMLVMTGDTLNMMSLIGLIMLMGLVTKNAILLVDFSNVLRGRGLTRREAVIQAGRTRLRPIIMTTTAMVFGMLPLALGIGAGGEMRAPMARAVIGGLITSTLLTLVVVPVAYTLLDDVSAWFMARRTTHAAPATAGMVLVLAGLLGLGATPVSAQPAAPRLAGLSLPRDPAAGAGLAPQAAAPVRVLSLDQALALAAAQNYDVKKAMEYQAWVRGRYLEERAAALPQVTVAGTALRTFDNSQSKLFQNIPGFGGGSDEGGIGEVFGGRQDIRTANVAFSQVVFTWGQVGAAIRAARIGYTLADEQLRRFQQTVARDVSRAFYDVLAAKEATSIAQENLAQRQRHLQNAKQRQAAGTATDYDVLAASVDVDNARPAVIRAQNAVRLARDQLRFLLAEPAAEIDVTGTLGTAVAPPPDYADVLAQALQNRPELGELASTRGIYTELVTIAKAGDKPRVDFSGTIGVRNLSLPSMGATGRTWNAALVATMPLFDGQRTKGRVAQARVDLSRATLDELKARDGVAVEVHVAIDAVQEAREILAALGETVKQAETLLGLAEKGYELGVKSTLEVQDAQTSVLAARVNLARAQRDYRVALVDLAWVAGTLDTGQPTP